MEMRTEYKLTQYSHGAGCGCKISPKVLNTILQHKAKQLPFAGLLVGNEERDDAAVMDLGDGTAIISTTDFFMPIVDDPEDFGRIASVNAISDIYAMGGTPLLAIAILGWPINQIPADVANQVIEGSRNACSMAGIPLAGGHSIDSPEPIFGLAVTGRVNIDQLKRNGGAKVGSRLFLTKPLGVGILATAEKKGKLKVEHTNIARDSMVSLNSIGTVFGQLPQVLAMTDVTGFGLLGHLGEMCTASGLSAVLDFDKVPLLNREALDFYLTENCVPGGTTRNWDAYGDQMAPLTEYQKQLMCDPQTSGGLLVAVDPAGEQDFLAIATKYALSLECIGQMVPQRAHLVIVE
ncbi:MAG: selenide, water dikinase [Saprospiraceae bacterium]|nr:MAG: selenide, water dikinase [Saprospiraceae bacterium]